MVNTTGVYFNLDLLPVNNNFVFRIETIVQKKKFAHFHEIIRYRDDCGDYLKKYGVAEPSVYIEYFAELNNGTTTLEMNRTVQLLYAINDFKVLQVDQGGKGLCVDIYFSTNASFL